MTDIPLRLGAIAVLLAAGVLAGAQLGKIAPLVEWYRTELGFSFVLSGWLTSAIGIFVALAALPAGWVIERVGARPTVFVGSVALSVGALALALFGDPNAILGARLVEGLGYVVLVIALPAAMASISPPGWRPTVLAIWSCFVPVGFAVSDLAGAWLIPAYGPPTYLLIVGLAYPVVSAIGVLLLTAVADVDDGETVTAFDGRLSTTLTLPVILVAVCFGVWVVMTVSFFAFMPAYITSQGSGMLVSAGIIALTVPLGNFFAAAITPGRSTRFIIFVGALGLIGTVLLAYPTFAGSVPWAMTGAAIGVAVLGGITGSMLYAVIPALVARGGSVPIAIGVVAQCGGIGTLFGPPLAGHVIESAGWVGFALFISGTAVICLLILAPLLSRRADAG
jgi:MFS family permease